MPGGAAPQKPALKTKIDVSVHCRPVLQSSTLECSPDVGSAGWEAPEKARGEPTKPKETKRSYPPERSNPINKQHQTNT